MKNRSKNVFNKKKSLGQNFLVNKGILKIIVDTADIKKGELVLEVGPGRGILTEALLSAGARVTAIEKDNRLIAVLEEKFGAEIRAKKFILIEGDALKIDIGKVVGSEEYKVVANIPYYITGALLRLLFSQNNLPTFIVLMLQKEVAKRIVATDGKESLLSLSVKAYGEPKYVKTVSKGSFSPMPSVDSAILSITNISKDFFDDFSEDLFFKIIHAGFSSKRKLVIRNLGKITDKKTIEMMLGRLKINQKARAENLTLSAWRRVCESVHLEAELPSEESFHTKRVGSAD
jgi:16S rRNA (adenine1518-N6/adenine1519-N6)-dimethyltransferase